MRPLRNLSARPEVLVDHFGRRLRDPVSNTVVGWTGRPLGRDRLVNTLPLNGGQGPVQLDADTVLNDSSGFSIAAPDGTLIGEPGVLWVHRMLDARWTQDTRRLT